MREVLSNNRGVLVWYLWERAKCVRKENHRVIVKTVSRVKYQRFGPALGSKKNVLELSNRGRLA